MGGGGVGGGSGSSVGGGLRGREGACSLARRASWSASAILSHDHERLLIGSKRLEASGALTTLVLPLAICCVSAADLSAWEAKRSNARPPEH